MQENVPQIPNPAMPNPATPNKSGCGCCGCLTGCLFVFLLPFILMGIVYFTVDLGGLADQVIDLSYREIFRPRIIEASLSTSLAPADKQAALKVSDQFIEDYLKLPKEEKRYIRHEAITYLYYDMQNKKLPPSETPHLNNFINAEKQKLQSNPAFHFLNNPSLKP